MDGNEAGVFLTLSFLTVIAGVLVIVLGLRHRLKILEMAHRERLAMIDRGLVPPPDRGATAFFHAIGAKGYRPAATNRRLSFGIALVGWGIGLAVLIGFAFDAPGAGVGIGGAFVAFGAAMITAAVLTRDASAPDVPAPPVFPPVPAEPPRSTDTEPR